MSSPEKQAGRSLKSTLRKLIPKPVLRTLRRSIIVPFRRVSTSRIPIAMITGSSGKTTTTRMLAHILKQAGHRVGFTSTGGIEINGRTISHKDSSGYFGASKVIKDPTISAAVLEVARGDLIKSGLYIDRCTTAAMLNVGKEHIGIDGIANVEEMATLKSRVLQCATGTVVLNADDALCVKFIDKYPTGRLILFSLKEGNPFIVDHLSKGGVAYILHSSQEEEAIQRITSESIETVVSVPAFPACMNGWFPQNIANAMAAAALAEGMNTPMQAVRTALESFENSLEHSPGRLNLIDGYSITVLIDRAVTIPSITPLVESLNRIPVNGRKLCMVDNIGQRPDWHYVETSIILASYFDHFVCYELEDYRRGFAPGEITAKIKSGLLQAGIPHEKISTAQGFSEALEALSQAAQEGDLVVILSSQGDPHAFLPELQERFARFKRPYQA